MARSDGGSQGRKALNGYEIYLEGAKKYGWLDAEFIERKKIDAEFIERQKKIAKNLLLLGLPIEKVAEATELSIETVEALL